MKIRIFQPIVPEYRKALFEGVGKRYGDAVEIWASEGSGQDKSYPLEHMRYDYSHPFINIGPIRWQRGLSLKGLTTENTEHTERSGFSVFSGSTKRSAVIVICGDIHQLSSLWIAFCAKLRGIRVVWWGHHVSSTSTERGIAIRLFFTRFLSDVVLCYTQAGIDWYRARNWKTPVFATGNTIDMNAVKKAIAYWREGDRLEKFQIKHGLKFDVSSLTSKTSNFKHQTSNSTSPDVVVICGVLRNKLRLEQLIKAMASPVFKARGTKLVVIGDGESKASCEGIAADLGIADRVVWTGALRDQMDIAPWFMSAKAFVYPGIIGLSIIHAFAYGLPVVCHGNKEHHGPEFAAHEDGKTGYVFKENDVDDFAAKIGCLLQDEPTRLQMSAYVQNLAYTKYGMETMMDNYCAAIEAASKMV